MPSLQPCGFTLPRFLLFPTRTDLLARDGFGLSSASTSKRLHRNFNVSSTDKVKLKSEYNGQDVYGCWRIVDRILSPYG